jgi:uncharacterized protein YaeQ
MDRQVYEDHNLTIACHPSETASRMMLRILAFALQSGERLEFGRGISADDEPDLWRKSLIGDIDLWIDLGTPDESRIRKACGRSAQVLIYCYGDRAVPIWWQKVSATASRFKNLQIYQIDDEAYDALATMTAPGMTLQCTISDGTIFLTDDNGDSLELHPRQLN